MPDPSHAVRERPAGEKFAPGLFVTRRSAVAGLGGLLLAAMPAGRALRAAQEEEDERA